jgi:hypothetical protein
LPVFSRGDVTVLYVHVPRTGGTSVEKFFMHNGFTRLMHSRDGLRTVLRVLSCSPQHYHADLLKGVFRLERFDYTFMTVRHPVDRIKSEYELRWQRGSERRPFDEWVEETLARYATDPYVLDNHIRPQHEFLVPGSDVYRVEDGLGDAWVELLSERSGIAFDTRIVPGRYERPSSPEITVGERSLELLERFYAQDYATLGYELTRSQGYPNEP